MSQKTRHQILEAKAEVIKISQKEVLENQMIEAGFDISQFSEFEKALLLQIGLVRHEVVEAIEEFGSMIEDYIGEGDEN